MQSRNQNRSESLATSPGARRASGDVAAAAPSEPPDPEVVEKAKRRTFSAAYRLRIIREVDRLAGTGKIGELLRREGLYSSHLSKWRTELERGELAALTSKKRGRKTHPDKALEKENARLAREVERLHQRLAQAEAIIDVQKKVASLLGVPPSKGNVS